MGGLRVLEIRLRTRIWGTGLITLEDMIDGSSWTRVDLLQYVQWGARLERVTWYRSGELVDCPMMGNKRRFERLPDMLLQHRPVPGRDA